MKRKVHESRYFCGNKISEYGLECGYLDYGTLARAFDAVMCNNITNLFYAEINGEYQEAEQINGYIDNSDEIDELREELEELEAEQREVFQWFIVSDYGAELLQEYTDDPVYYLPVMDVYVWGVTHWGTSWDYVLTDVKLELE